MKTCILLSLLVGVTKTLSVPLLATEPKTGYSKSAVSASASKDDIRAKRSFRRLHNYPDIVFDMVQDKEGNPGPWKNANCNLNFNCSTVSPHYCNTQSYPFYHCSDNEVSEDCIFSFTLNIDLITNQYLDMDLSLYKAKETKPRFYYVFLVYLLSPFVGYIVSDKGMASSCSQWQVFHIDEISQFLKNGTNILNFRIIMFEDGPVPLEMSCDRISNIFLMKAPKAEVVVMEDSPTAGTTAEDTTIAGDSPTAGNSPSELYDSTTTGDSLTVPVTEDNPVTAAEYSHTPTTEDTFTPQQPTMTPGEEIPSDVQEQLFSIASDAQIDYIPILTIFTTRSSKRKRDVSTTITDGHLDPDRGHSSSNLCRRVDKLATLDNLAAQGLSVLHPATHNVGECKYEGEGGPSIAQYCTPTSFKSVQMLVRRSATEYALHRNHDTVIDECGLTLPTVI